MSEQLIDPFGGVLVEDTANEDRDPFGGVLVGGSSASKPNFSPSSFNATFQNPDETFYEDDLRVTPEWIQASKVIYRMNEGNTADDLPSDTDYANYGLDFMGWFNSNIVNMGVKAHGTRTAKPEQAKAMLYLMDSYTAKGFSWEGTGRFFKGALTDPTNLVGLGTLGLGFVASKAAGALTKQGIRQALVEATKTGLIGAGEGAYISALDDYNRQVVETAVSGEEVDKGRLLKSAGTGFVLGGVFTGSLGYTGAKIGQKAKAKKQTDAEIEAEMTEKRYRKNDLNRAKKMGEEANAKVKEEIKAREKVSTEALDPGSPNTPAGRTITALSDLRKSIAELVPEGKVVGLTVNNVQKYKELTEAVEPLKQILKEAGKDIEAVELLEHFEKFEMTTAQMNAMAHLVQRTASELGDMQNALIKQYSKLKGEKAAAVYTQFKDTKILYDTLAKIDSALAANTARTLGIRRLSKHKGDVLGVSVEDLQKEGYTQSQAMQLWSEMWEQSHVKAQRDNRVVSLKKRRDKAEARGGVAEFNLLQNEIDALVEEIRLEELYKQNPIFGRMGEYFNKSMGITAEVMVSNVFSPSSVMINIVPSIAKSIYQPITDRVFQHGISRVAFKAALTEYSAMYSVIPSAAKMAKTAWDLERSMLTGDSSKFLEDQTHIPKRLKGHWMRLFPRAMLASDAFFEQVLYRGHISGQAAGNAMEEGIAKGLKGKKLDDFVQKKVVKAVDESYEPNKNPMGVLRADGKSRGLYGEALDKHIEEGLEKYADSFLTATSEQGKDYVQRSLFKNAPSEKNVPSKALKWYEDTVKDNPLLRVIGQLFTRTPVRVFEEGVRMTPGFQFIHPSFVNDLAGVNGNLARVRAQRDVFIGQAITAWVFTKYVAGEATGQQTQDYKRGRQVEDAGLVGAYSFKLKDGSSINFRNLDPFSTPMKITLNALERYEELEYRKSQGEFIDASELRKAEQWMSVGLGSMYQAVRDANLTSGADEMIKVAEGFASGKEDVAMKFLGQVATRVLPNSWYKISMLDDPVLGDPKTIEQYLEYRINPQSQTVNKQHTALGQVRTSKNPVGGLIPLTRTTVEERKLGLTEQEAEAEEWLLHVAQVGDRNFAPPATKNPSVSYDGLSVRIDADLGEMLTTNKKANAKHGQETMYNRWMRYYRDTNPAEAVLATKGYALGTASNPNEVETMTSEIINERRAIGFLQLMEEEPELEALFFIGQERALKNEAGMNYQQNTPITGTR